MPEISNNWIKCQAAFYVTAGLPKGDQNGAIMEATVTRQGFMNNPLCKYHTFLFIKGAQMGDDTTFAVEVHRSGSVSQTVHKGPQTL
jgi:hypothetical protein